MKNFLEINSSDGYTMWMPLNCNHYEIVKMVNYMLCIFYLNLKYFKGTDYENHENMLAHMPRESHETPPLRT